jgi:hypothetical protein
MARDGWTKQQIHNLYELQDYVMNMADASSQRIHIENVNSLNINQFGEYDELKDKDEFWNNEFFAVVNSRTKEISQICTDRYQILRHRDYFGLMISELESLGLTDVSGYALEKNHGDLYKIRLLFDNNYIEEPEVGMNLQLGVEFFNSYDKFLAAGGNAHFYRLSCSNGMVVKNIVSNLDFSRNHNARDRESLMSAVSAKTNGFIKGMLQADKEFFKVILAANESEVTFDNLVQMYSSMEELFGKRHGKEIGDNLKVMSVRDNYGKYHANRWKIYNSVTYHTSHAAMSPDIFDKLQYTAENKILDTKAKIPMPVPKQRVIQ